VVASCTDYMKVNVMDGVKFEFIDIIFKQKLKQFETENVRKQIKAS